MKAKIIEGIYLKKESRSYIDCLHAVLTNTGMYNGPKYLLSGMTGFAFIFVAHKDLILASTEMYSLKATAWCALDILGYYSEAYDGLKTYYTFPLYQKMAIKRIKESIDKDVAVIVWAPGVTDFGVIFGYDDEDEAFFYRDRFHSDEQILLYKNLGKVEASYWLCQIIGDRIEKDIRDIYLDSLEKAVDSWETKYINENVLRQELGSGRKAYEYLISALESYDFYDRGAANIIYHNVVSRIEASMYLDIVKDELPEAFSAYIKYKELGEVYSKIKKLLPPHPIPGQEFKIDRVKQLPGIIELLKSARDIEEVAIGELKLLLKDRLNNRYIDIYDVKKFRI